MVTVPRMGLQESSEVKRDPCVSSLRLTSRRICKISPSARICRCALQWGQTVSWPEPGIYFPNCLPQTVHAATIISLICILSSVVHLYCVGRNGHPIFAPSSRPAGCKEKQQSDTPSGGVGEKDSTEPGRRKCPV